MTESAATERWYKPSELAAQIGVGPAAILARLRRGTLRGEKSGTRWRISAEVAAAEMAAYEAQAVSKGHVRLLRVGDGRHPSLGPGGADDETLRLLLEAKDQVIAAKDQLISEKDLTIGRLRQELAAQRVAMAALLGVTTPAAGDEG